MAGVHGIHQRHEEDTVSHKIMTQTPSHYLQQTKPNKTMKVDIRDGIQVTTTARATKIHRFQRSMEPKKDELEIRQVASSRCCFWYTSHTSLQLQNSTTRRSHTTRKSDFDLTRMEHDIQEGGLECKQQQPSFDTSPVHLVTGFI